MPRSLILTGCVLVAVVSACSRASQHEDTPPAFVGSDVCASCHAAEYDAWTGSHHELAMQPAADATMLGDFDASRFEYFDETFEFSSNDGEFFVTALGANGERKTWPVTYAFGIEPLQQYLVEAGDGRKQALPVVWDTRPAAAGGQRWFHLYPDEYVGPGDPLHWTGPYQNWNFMCAECHSTDVAMGYDFAADSFATTYAEVSVGCEACHGPGSTHVAQAERGTLNHQLGLTLSLDDHDGAAWAFAVGASIATRTRPAALPTRQAEACGRCHARRGPIAPQYRHGDRLADSHSISLLDAPLYFADGQILGEVYVYGSFVQSRMYRAGVTCDDCHEPHTAKLRTGPNPSDVCAQCHLPTEFASRDHTGHEPQDAACVDCHMTSRTYMGVDDRRDHSFRVPRPDLHAAIDVPVACDDCHATDVLAASGEQKSRPHFGDMLHEARQRLSNSMIADAQADEEIPAIARATLLALLTPPFGQRESRAIAAALESPAPLIRIGALRALRLAAPALKAEFDGKGLADPVRSVRFEAVTTYVEVRDLLTLENDRAFGRAAEELRESYRLMGNMPDALANLAGFESAMGNHDDALRHLQRAVRKTPGIAALQHALGLAHVRVGDHYDALEALRRAHELEPAESRFVYVYGVALNSLGQTDEAIAVLRQALDEHEDDRDIGWALVTILRDAGMPDEARSVALALAEKHPGESVFKAILRELNGDNPDGSR
ncbi:MAG: tetratricopeptide repeat protein [Woeseiaceae bacterium]|nr:tetratricopeptide repeat protein [Woeseiaceae bacterium]